MSSSSITRFPAAAATALILAGIAPISSLVAQQTSGSARSRIEAERAREEANRSPTFGVIDGFVSDTLDHPIHTAEATIVGSGIRVVTGENGRFRFQKVPTGQYIVVVRRIGYAPTSTVIQVKDADTLRLTYTLARSIVAMDTVRVNATRVSLRMLEFEARARTGMGQFMNQATIDRRPALQTFDLLRQFRGIDVSRNTSGAFAGTFALSKREGSALTGGCAMQVLLDGIIMPRNFDIELLPPPKQLAGIEVYEGPATIPPQFSGADRRCGLIAVWTRDGY